MAVRKTFNIDTCGECIMFLANNEPEGICRYDPPRMVNGYTAAFPIVKRRTTACFAGIARPQSGSNSAKKAGKK